MFSVKVNPFPYLAQSLEIYIYMVLSVFPIQAYPGREGGGEGGGTPDLLYGLYGDVPLDRV